MNQREVNRILNLKKCISAMWNELEGISQILNGNSIAFKLYIKSVLNFESYFIGVFLPGTI